MIIIYGQGQGCFWFRDAMLLVRKERLLAFVSGSEITLKHGKEEDLKQQVCDIARAYSIGQETYYIN